MKNWLIKLNVRMGEYEDTTYHCVRAPCKERAIKLGFAGEERCELQWEDGGESAFDCNGEIYIELYSVEEVTNAELKVLNKYL